ncbi:hypothetical protein Msub_10336 [Marinobacter subterrani]|uniref:Uncharacterized protein n=1 Tax=Marinobacter subterrani TaxID=1658765 RepID=A0A0J7J7M7_9GAMM|nr:hypothetical protein Msub_10336 [Marinobacter subterrani]
MSEYNLEFAEAMAESSGLILRSSSLIALLRRKLQRALSSASRQAAFVVFL